MVQCLILNFVDKKSYCRYRKSFKKYGIITLGAHMKKVLLGFVLIGIAIVLVVYGLQKLIGEQPKKELEDTQEKIEEVKEQANLLSVQSFIKNVELKLVQLQLTNPDYQMPTEITDPYFVSIPGTIPIKVHLQLDSQGTVMTGEFQFDNGTYIYDGVTVKKA